MKKTNRLNLEIRKAVFYGEEKRRILDVWFRVTGPQAEEIFDEIKSIIEDRLQEHFLGCPVKEEDYYEDNIPVDFSFGEMKQIKKDVIDVYKMVKQGFNL